MVAGNWKMNTNIQSGIKLAKEIQQLLEQNPVHGVDVVIAPPMVHLASLAKEISTEKINLAAQNVATEKQGAFTGEVSAEMILSAGASHVIIGHSERRKFFHETDAQLALKVDQTLSTKLVPIFCCGEELESREKSEHFQLVAGQIQNGLFHLNSDDFKKIILAYEPVWAIGTGLTASPAQAEEMHAFIRNLIAKQFGEEVAESTTILYGGSCKASNAGELFAQHNVDGGLIGGASLDAQEFIKIIQSF